MNNCVITEYGVPMLAMSCVVRDLEEHRSLARRRRRDMRDSIHVADHGCSESTRQRAAPDVLSWQDSCKALSHS